MKQVHSKSAPAQEDAPTPESLLFSESEEDEAVKAYAVHVQDQGSISQCVKVQIQGVPAYGLIDTGADISIIGGKLFKRVATIAHLKKRDFKKADKVPRTYDQRTFKLDGRMDMDITFEGKTMCTPVYIKMNATDQLLLSEGVCRQLGVVTFHPKVERWRGSGRSVPGESPTVSTPASSDASVSQAEPLAEAKVPAVRVSLVQSAHLLPHQRQVVEVSLDNLEEQTKPLLLEESLSAVPVEVEEAVIDVTEDGRAFAVCPI